jgi:hypothetical protein
MSKNQLPKGSDALESLLADYGEREDTFDVSLSNGKTLKFRTLPAYRDVRNFLTNAIQWVDTIVKDGPPAELRVALAGLDEETLRKVYEISALSVEPSLSQLDVALLSKKAGFLFTQIYAAVLVRIDPTSRAASRVEIEESKKESGAMSSTETS